MSHFLLRAQSAIMINQQMHPLVRVKLDGKISQLFLDSLPEAVRQEHNYSKQLKQLDKWGGLAYLHEDGTYHSALFDPAQDRFDPIEETYMPFATALASKIAAIEFPEEIVVSIDEQAKTTLFVPVSQFDWFELKTKNDEGVIIVKVYPAYTRKTRNLLNRLTPEKMKQVDSLAASTAEILKQHDEPQSAIKLLRTVTGLQSAMAKFPAPVTPAQALHYMINEPWQPSHILTNFIWSICSDKDGSHSKKTMDRYIDSVGYLNAKYRKAAIDERMGSLQPLVEIAVDAGIGFNRDTLLEGLGVIDLMHAQMEEGASFEFLRSLTPNQVVGEWDDRHGNEIAWLLHRRLLVEVAKRDGNNTSPGFALTVRGDIARSAANYLFKQKESK